MTHDFDKTLEDMSDNSAWVEENWDTLQFALKLAKKVMGEPSEGIAAAGLFGLTQQRVTETASDGIKRCFKSMRDQAVKEILQQTEGEG